MRGKTPRAAPCATSPGDDGPAMSMLDRKLRRDLRALLTQALAVALVMACGLAMMIMTRSLILSLSTTRDEYYSGNRFAEVFARLKRAPHSVEAELSAIPGVAQVETGIAVQVTLDVPGLAETAVGLINSLPERGEPRLNRLHVRAGRLPEGRASRGELAVGEALVSFLDDKGRPSVTERVYVLPPCSQIGPITPEQRKTLLAESLVAGVYEKEIDRDSAFEAIKGRTQARQPTGSVAPAPISNAPGATPTPPAAPVTMAGPMAGVSPCSSSASTLSMAV